MPLRPSIRSRSLSTLIACLALTGTAHGQTVPSEDVETAETFAAEQRASLAELRKQIPETPPQAIDRLVRLDVVNGNLIVTRADPKGPEQVNFAPEGDAMSCFQMRVHRVETDPPMELLSANVMRLDPAVTRAINVQLLPSPISLNFSITIETLGSTTGAQLIQQTPMPGGEGEAPTARLYMSRDGTDNAANDARINLAEPTFAALVTGHHDEAVAMLGEGLTTLRAMHVLSGVGLDEARSIFAAEAPIDDAVNRELDAIVSDLGKRGSAAVPELRARLRKLGPSAAAALHRRPRAGWAADLALNVDTLTADLMPGSADKSSSLLASRGRLIDLLYAPDVAIRRGALGRLNTLVGEKLTIDVEKDPYAQVAKIEALRTKIATPER